MIKKILVCTDGSECSKGAALTAAEIATRFVADVVLVNVSNPAPAIGPYMMAAEAIPDISGIQQGLLEAQQAIIEGAKTELESAGIHPRVRAETGQPVFEIVRAAEEENADLIVLGSRGMGGFQRLLMGSVSDGVLHHAHCPVLIVR
jgi:nucleotide-binding universal stress UspA family protein